MNTETQRDNLTRLLRPRYTARTYPPPQHNPKQIADCCEKEGRKAAMHQFGLTEHWVRHFHRQFYPPKPHGGQPRNPERRRASLPEPKNAFLLNCIECGYREEVIRHCYALLQAGLPVYGRLQELSRRELYEAWQVPYEAVIAVVLQGWRQVKNKPKPVRI